MGGLGIRSLISFNLALLGKWLWWFRVERERLWRKVIGAKYSLRWGDWCTEEVTHSHGRSLWKGIWLGREEFWMNMSILVGVGTRVRF